MVLNNLNIINFERLETIKIKTREELIRQFKYKEECFFLEFSQTVNLLTGEIYNISNLEFNATKFFNGHNIYNSDIEEIKSVLKIIREKLFEKNIILDLSQARVKELELNVTCEQGFKELSEILLLFGRSNNKGAISIYSFSKENVPDDIKKDRTLYLNKSIKSHFKKSTGKIIKIYDKSFELLTKNKITVDKELTRIEILLGRDYFRSMLEKYNLSNNLYDFLNSDLLNILYTESIKKEIVTKPLKELDKIKKTLNKNFKNFRRNENLKRQERERYKFRGKEIPELYKEERGVFEYLKNNFWIFDYSFLWGIVDNNIPAKNKKSFKNQILKKYSNINNLYLYEKFLKKIRLL